MALQSRRRLHARGLGDHCADDCALEDVLGHLVGLFVDKTAHPMT
jgi:hypothetical protein